MRDYFLFLDTEASGLPKNWNLPYTDTSNWPSAVQVAWLVYARDGSFIKKENHYIFEKDIFIAPSAVKIHGISQEYLSRAGESRTVVMQLLADDLHAYQPLVIGHFMEFDSHIISADFQRAGIYNPLTSLPSFCTMRASSFYVRNPVMEHLRLGELYTMLFEEKLDEQHNALADAEATAKCFFELQKRGDVTDEKIAAQQQTQKTGTEATVKGFIVFILIALVFAVLLSFWIK